MLLLNCPLSLGGKSKESHGFVMLRSLLLKDWLAGARNDGIHAMLLVVTAHHQQLGVIEVSLCFILARVSESTGNITRLIYGKFKAFSLAIGKRLEHLWYILRKDLVNWHFGINLLLLFELSLLDLQSIRREIDPYSEWIVVLLSFVLLHNQVIVITVVTIEISQ